MPTVIWYRDDLPITTEAFETPERPSVRSEITLGPLGREDLNTRLSCRAINHPRASPLESTVQVDMNCKYNLFAVQYICKIYTKSVYNFSILYIYIWLNICL